MKVCVAQVMYLDVSSKSLERVRDQIRERLLRAFDEPAWVQVVTDRGVTSKKPPKRPRLQLVAFGQCSIAKCYPDGAPMGHGVRVRAPGFRR